MLRIEITTRDTPTNPHAKRGDCSDQNVQETPEQIKNNLVWWPCSFCSCKVLVNIWGRGEICKCGARRIKRKYREGWKRGNDEMFFI